MQPLHPVTWQVRGRRLDVSTRPLVMGIVNVTPDSFSDGGRFFDPAAAVDHGRKLADDGADILDVGGESTRPGADPVPLDEELRRVVGAVRELAKRVAVPVSVDTSKAEVARRAVDAGAAIVNDVTGLRGDPAMPKVVAESGAGAVVMHMQGTPQTMHLDPRYEDVVQEVGDFLDERLAAAADAGIAPEQIAVDPGIGFGKRTEHTLQQLARLGEYRRFGRPVVLGVSRKGFIGKLCGRDAAADRLAGTLAVNCFALAAGAAHVFRVHDVAAHADAAKMWAALAPHVRRDPPERPS